ncbi:MAG TPA: 5'/3'-nucleotidase SurE [Vicinamibacterales bacterium]|nr:5'/3'-nucleotidase SurE [Vicinamibacterales bacterium]
MLRRLTACVTFSAALCAVPIAQTPPRPYRILVTNDDGVRAPGLLALAQALRGLGEVTIVAPAENQSGKAHSLTISDPIYVDRVELPGGLPAWSAVATPASCVKVAVGAIMAEKPDLVVSGINRGYNLAAVSYVSGTVGAAREAALQGIPAIAASLAVQGHPHYDPGAEMVRRIADVVKTRGLGRGVFLNVNIPSGPAEALKGLRVARQSMLSGKERFEEQKSPGGRRYFWSIWEEPSGDAEGTDVWITEQGYVAVVPLRVGEFDQAAFDTLKATQF